MQRSEKLILYCFGTVFSIFSIILLIIIAILALPLLLLPHGKIYYINQLESIDQLVNVHYCGDPDETISSRRGKGSRSNLLRKLINAVFPKVNGIDHCTYYVESDEGGKAIK